MDYDELFKVCDNKQYVDINFIMKNNIFFFFFFFFKLPDGGGGV